MFNQQVELEPGKQSPQLPDTSMLEKKFLQKGWDRDATHYNMSHPRRGKAYIFNHTHFDPVQQLKARIAADTDRDNLRVCLRQLDFEVEVFEDLPVKDINRVLENAALEDHSDADCVLVAGTLNTISQ